MLPYVDMVLNLKKREYIQTLISEQQSHSPVVQALTLCGYGGLGMSDAGWAISYKEYIHLKTKAPEHSGNVIMDGRMDRRMDRQTKGIYQSLACHKGKN